MKSQLVTKIFLGVLTLSLATAISSMKAEAQTATFSCSTSKGLPTTVAQTPRGAIPVIRWKSDHFSKSGWSPQQRCEAVSKRFQEYSLRRELNFLTTGIMNNQPVVCTTDREGGSCINLLFTLKPGSNPGQTLQNLLAVRVRARGPLNESSSRVFVDMREYLETTPVEDVSRKSSASETQVEPTNTGSTKPRTNSELW